MGLHNSHQHLPLINLAREPPGLDVAMKVPLGFLASGLISLPVRAFSSSPHLD